MLSISEVHGVLTPLRGIDGTITVVHSVETIVAHTMASHTNSTGEIAGGHLKVYLPGVICGTKLVSGRLPYRISILDGIRDRY